MILPSTTTAAPFRLGAGGRVVWLSVAVLSLVVRSGFAIHAIGYAGLDDALFVRLARNIGAGQWLGAFNNTTLVKGAFYPLFILGAFLAGIPLKLAEQAVYLLAAALVAVLVVRSERRRSAGTLLFAALAFCPVFWTVELSRVVREGVYVGLSLAVFGLLVTTLFSGRGFAAVAARGLLLGLVGGAYWTTREEGVWLLPAAATVLALRLLPAGRSAARDGRRRRLGVGLAGAGLGFAAVLGANVAANDRVYGLPERLEVTSAPFEHAYGALSRIAVPGWERYVVFPAAARQLAYRVSPAAAELRDALDGEVGARWRRASCAEAPGTECPEVLSSWFQWALRDAVASAGHYGSLPEAAGFYDRLARELDAACDAGRIDCLPARATLAPPFRWHFLSDAAARARTLLPVLLRGGGDVVRTAPSEGPEDQIDAFEDTVGPVLRRPDLVSVFDGTVRTTAGPPALAIRSAPGRHTRSDIELDAPDADGAAHFRVSADCPPAGCDLVVSAGGTALGSVLLDALAAPARVEQPGFAVAVADANQRFARRGQNGRSAAILALARPVGRLYAAAVPPLALVGLLGILLVLPARRWDLVRSPVFALAAGSAVAVASRVALVAYLDVTAIPTAGILYLSPAAPFVLVGTVTGCLLLANLVRGRLA